MSLVLEFSLYSSLALNFLFKADTWHSGPLTHHILWIKNCSMRTWHEATLQINWGSLCRMFPPSMATDIDIAALVTSDGCQASDPLSLLSPRLSPGLAILATSHHTGPRLSRSRPCIPGLSARTTHWPDHGHEPIITWLKHHFWRECKIKLSQ